MAKRYQTRRGSQGGSGDRLWTVCKKLPSDFEPYGTRSRLEGPQWECSCGCRFFLELPGDLGRDWGVCVNGSSPRAGLLTFEHQGCRKFSRR
jgi:hypothetical protein